MFNIILISKENEQLLNNETNKALISRDSNYKVYNINDNIPKLNYLLSNLDDYKVIIINSKNIRAKEIIKTIRGQDSSSFIIGINYNHEKTNETIDLHTTFIENFNTELYQKYLQHIFNLLDSYPKSLVFKYDGCINHIAFNDILYIEKENNCKTVDLICKHNKYCINRSLIELEELLDNNFVRTHRSALVNIINIRKIDLVNNIIYFKNGTSCNLLSRSHKRLIKDIITKKGIKLTN